MSPLFITKQSQTTTRAPVTTTTMATAAATEDDSTTKAQVDNGVSTTSYINGDSSTTESGVTQPGGGSQETTASSGGAEVDKTPIRETPMSISFDYDFDDFVAKFVSAEEARKTLCEETMRKMVLTPTAFTQCVISSGSVVVTFVLVQSEQAGNSTVDSLRSQVHGNTLVLEILGTSYNVDPESLVVDNEPQKPPPAEEDESDSTVVIIVVVIVLLIIIIVVVVAFFVVKNKQNQNNKV